MISIYYIYFIIYYIKLFISKSEKLYLVLEYKINLFSKLYLS